MGLPGGDEIALEEKEMTGYKAAFHAYAQQHRNEMIDMLRCLVSMRSDRDEAKLGEPFGKQCADILRLTERLYAANGFKTKNCIRDGYLLAYCGEGEKSIGLFAHADTVESQNDWLLTHPYTPLLRDGFLIGRGVKDDKAGIVISLWCARMFRDLQIPLRSRLILFTGCNEESGMQDIENFAATEEMPSFNLVCDTAFPIYVGDKGGLIVECETETPFETIQAFEGGESANISLGEAKACMPFTEELWTELSELQDSHLAVTKDDGKLWLNAKGISTHGALPEGALNAGLLAAKALLRCKSIQGNDRIVANSLVLLLEDVYGEMLGIGASDVHFGPVTCTNGKVSLHNGRVRCTLDIRHGDSVHQSELLANLENGLKNLGFKITAITRRALPWRLEESNPFVQGLDGVYREMTSDTRPIRYNAGRTYACCLKNAIEVGTSTGGHSFPDSIAGHGNVHQPDEMLSIDGFTEAFELIASMLIEADRILNL